MRRPANGAGYDFIVVGGGAAGCVVAARLSEDPKARVLLLEAGPRDRNPLIHVPGAAAFTLAAPSLNWSRMTEPQPALGGRALYLAQGRVIGGSSSINGMVYTRAAPADYDDWAEHGAEGWRFEDVLPWFRKAETFSGAARTWRGQDGPLQVRRGEAGLGCVEAFLDGASEIGLPLVEDLNAPGEEGLGLYDWMIGRGRRSSAARAYLAPALRRPNLTVLPEAQATRLLVEKGRATGVEYLHRGARRQASASCEVVLTGGAINSPQLLMLSGIGPADHLRATGIDPVLDAPSVGANLRNHLSYQFSFRCSAPVSAYSYLSPLRGAAELLKYGLGRRGFLAQAAAPAGGFYRSSERAERADMQAFMVPVILGGLGAGLRALLPSEHGLCFFVNQGRPYSSGTVRLRSADPLQAPAIDPGHLSDPRDLEVMIDGVERMSGIGDTAAFRKIGAQRVGGPTAAGRQAIEASIRAEAGQHYHVCGTCSIGRDASGSVVDSRLRLHGVAGLRVADASVMPRLLNANLAAPVMMIAERAAAFIKGDA